MDLLWTTLMEIFPSPRMDEESLEVKSLAFEMLRDLVRLLRMLSLWKLNTGMEEGSSPTGVPGRLSDVVGDGGPNSILRFPSVILGQH
jgi:hypothetical protein